MTASKPVTTARATVPAAVAAAVATIQSNEKPVRVAAQPTTPPTITATGMADTTRSLQRARFAMPLSSREGRTIRHLGRTLPIGVVPRRHVGLLRVPLDAHPDPDSSHL